MSRYNAEAEGINKVVGENIKKIRLAKKLTAKTVGGYIDVSYQQFYKYEEATNKIPLCKAIILARELGVSIVDLAGESEAYNSGTLGEINKHLTTLGEDVLFHILQSVRGLRTLLGKS